MIKKVVPNHIADILNLFHDIVFQGSDGEETFPQYLTLEEKECISLSLAVYYQCEECIKYHSKVLCKLKNIKPENLNKHIASMILFLRTDIAHISDIEVQRWLETWEQLSLKISTKYGNIIMPYLVGLSIGLARNDDEFITIFGKAIKKYYSEDIVEKVVGEVISVVIFMKSATSKNRIMDKVKNMLESD